MKKSIVLCSLLVIAGVNIQSKLNEKGFMVSHPFARLQMLVQSVLYKIYS